MKYTLTSRTLNLIFHGLIALGGIALGLYFGLIVAPCYLSANQYAWSSTGTGIDAPYNLFAELGIVGLTLGTISVYGFVNAVKGILDQRNDTVVVNGFNAFIAEGYIASLFCILNAAVYFDLVKGNSLGFVVALLIILFIGLMIATNIPMVKLYDNRDQAPLLSSLALAGAVFFAWAAVVTFGTCIGSWTNGAYAYSNIINTQLIVFVVVYAAIAALLALSGKFLAKHGLNDKKINTLTGHMTSGAVALSGLLFLATGIIEFVCDEKRVHLNNKDRLPASGVNSFAIMCLVVGALIVIGAVVFDFLASSGKLSSKKKRA